MRSNVPLLDKLGQQITIASVFFGPGADAFFDAINTVNSIEIPEGGQGAFAPLGSFTVTDPRITRRSSSSRPRSLPRKRSRP